MLKDTMSNPGNPCAQFQEIPLFPAPIKKKTGRKKGYRMPDWKKSLLAGRRESLSLEAVNLVMSRVGEALSEVAKTQDARFTIVAPSGKKKSLTLVSCNENRIPASRIFLFKDPETSLRVSYLTQEIYAGIISGAFAPMSTDVRKNLFDIIISSPEVQKHIRDRAMETRAKQKRELVQKEEFADEDVFSLAGDDAPGEEILQEIEARLKKGEVQGKERGN